MSKCFKQVLEQVLSKKRSKCSSKIEAKPKPGVNLTPTQNPTPKPNPCCRQTFAPLRFVAFGKMKTSFESVVFSNSS